MQSATKKAVSFLDSWLSYRVAQTDLVGLSVAILVDGKIILSRAYGVADIRSGVSLTSRHLFNVASQTKMLTAVLILQLAMQHALALDDPVYKSIPWLSRHPDSRARQITIRHLLSHGSGLPRETPSADYWLFKEPFPTKTDLKKIVLESELGFLPGTSIKYSNLGFALLGLVIETVGGASFQEQLESRILQPLRLHAVASDYNPLLDTKIATGYGLPYNGTRPPLSPRKAAKIMCPVTGLYATPEDMCRFAAALFTSNELLIPDELKREMRQTQSTIAEGYDAGVEFGLGHEVFVINDRRIFGHTGHVGGHVSATLYDPNGRIAVAVAVNARDTPGGAIAQGIFGALDFFLQNSYSNNAHDQQSRAFDIRLRDEMSAVEVIQHAGKIIIIDPDDWQPFGWHEELTSVNNETLRFTTPGSIYNQGELFTFNFNKNGNVAFARLSGRKLWPEETYYNTEQESK